MNLTWLLVFVGTFLLLVGVGIGSGLDTHLKRGLNRQRARDVRERNERHRRTLL